MNHLKARLQRTVNQSGIRSSVDTIYKSKGNIPEAFLRGCGVPEDMIAYARSLRGKAIDFYSCFISHSAKDKRICERLYADLQAKGVRVWYFPEDAKWGETVWGEIDRSIKIYDKLIVVCSENSLQSGPVNREIERALNREDKEGKGILFPIRIDDYIFDKWEHERKADALRKVVGDFSGWDKDAAKYDKAFDKLLKGLQAGA
jgi:TIR domain